VTRKEGTDAHRSNKKQSGMIIGKTHGKVTVILMGNVEIHIVDVFGTGCMRFVDNVDDMWLP
jgi:hypothetical protein